MEGVRQRFISRHICILNFIVFDYQLKFPDHRPLRRTVRGSVRYSSFDFDLSAISAAGERYFDKFSTATGGVTD